MNAVEHFRSQLLACGAVERDAAESARLYACALHTCEDADWEAFYRNVYVSLQHIRETERSLDVFSKIEVADVLLLLQDDLSARLFDRADIQALARDLLHRGGAIAH